MLFTTKLLAFSLFTCLLSSLGLFIFFICWDKNFLWELWYCLVGIRYCQWGLCVSHRAILIKRSVMCFLRGYFVAKEGYVLPIRLCWLRGRYVPHTEQWYSLGGLCASYGAISFPKQGYVTSYKDKAIPVRICGLIHILWAYGGLGRCYGVCTFWAYWGLG